MKMVIFPGAVISLLCFHTVSGFGMIDFLRAASQLEERHISRRTLKAPADAIVEVLLGELDTNGDSDVTLAEAGAYMDRSLKPRMGGSLDASAFQEVKGYMATLASLIDSDGDNIVQRNEMRRAAGLVVNLAGSIQVPKFIEPKYFFPRSSVNVTDAVVDKFMDVMDSNSDGEISSDERDAVFGLRRLGWRVNDAEVVAADQNGDGNLSEAELRQFLENTYSSAVKLLLVYMDTVQLVGKEIADKWAM